MSSPEIEASGSSESKIRIFQSKNPSRTPTSWDAEDDILLMHLKDNQKLGWKEIASNFTNRTPNACQFRWRRLKSGNLKNPPKSAAALGAQFKQNPNMNSAPKRKKPQLKITKVQLSQQIILPKNQIRKSFKSTKNPVVQQIMVQRGTLLAVVVIVQPIATTLLIIP